MNTKLNIKQAPAAPIAVIALAALAACAVPEDDGTTAADRSEVNSNGDDKAAESKDEADEPDETAAQENARGSAEDYRDRSAFSRSGLVDQLTFEGFTGKQAEYAVVPGQPPRWLTAAKVSPETAERLRLFPDGIPPRAKLTPEQARWLRRES